MESLNIEEKTPIKSGERKFWLAKTLSVVFIAASFSLLMFFGAAESGLIVRGNGEAAPSGFFKTERGQIELPSQLKFPEFVPFEVADTSPVEKIEMEAPSLSPYWIKIEGMEEQVLHLRYTPGARFVDQTDENLPEAVRETSVEIEAVKVNGKVGNYHETRFSNILSWQEEDVSMTISYDRGGSDKMLGKSALILVAESLK